MIDVTPQVLRKLEGTLYSDIPLSRAMAVRIVGFDTSGLTLTAPLAPNINHKNTAFGGSLNALATLAGWGMAQLLLGEQRAATVIIQESTTRFLLPVTGDLIVTCAVPDSDSISVFLRGYDRKGMSRIEMAASISAGDRIALQFRGRFVALDKTRYPASPST